MEVGRSLSETPSWSVAVVITTMVAIGFVILDCISHLNKVNGFFFFFFIFFSLRGILLQAWWFFGSQWLIRTKRKALLAALEEIVKGERHSSCSWWWFFLRLEDKFENLFTFCWWWQRWWCLGLCPCWWVTGQFGSLGFALNKLQLSKLVSLLVLKKIFITLQDSQDMGSALRWNALL